MEGKVLAFYFAWIEPISPNRYPLVAVVYEVIMNAPCFAGAQCARFERHSRQAGAVECVVGDRHVIEPACAVNAMFEVWRAFDVAVHDRDSLGVRTWIAPVVHGQLDAIVAVVTRLIWVVLTVEDNGHVIVDDVVIADASDIEHFGAVLALDVGAGERRIERSLEREMFDAGIVGTGRQQVRIDADHLSGVIRPFGFALYRVDDRAAMPGNSSAERGLHVGGIADTQAKTGSAVLDGDCAGEIDEVAGLDPRLALIERRDTPVRSTWTAGVVVVHHAIDAAKAWQPAIDWINGYIVVHDYPEVEMRIVLLELLARGETCRRRL